MPIAFPPWCLVLEQAVHLTGINAETIYETDACLDAQPFLYPLRNRRRPGRPPREKSFFSDKGLEKAAQRQAYLQQKQELHNQLQRLIRNGRLDFASVQEPISPQARQTLLSWVVKANANASKRARTEYGQIYTITCPQGKTCVLPCTDGNLTMPAYCLVFEEVHSHG